MEGGGGVEIGAGDGGAEGADGFGNFEIIQPAGAQAEAFVEVVGDAEGDVAGADCCGVGFRVIVADGAAVADAGNGNDVHGDDAAAVKGLRSATRSVLALKLKPLVAAMAKERQQASGGAVVQKSAQPPIDTRKEIASAAKVSEQTLSRVEVIEREAPEEIKAQARSGAATCGSAPKIARIASGRPRAEGGTRTRARSPQRRIWGHWRRFLDAGPGGTLWKAVGLAGRPLSYSGRRPGAL